MAERSIRRLGDPLSNARRITSIVVGVALVAVAVAALVATFVPIHRHLVLIAVVAAPYAMFAAPVAALVLAWGHRWLLTAFAGLLSAALLLVQLPLYIGATAQADSVAVRAMTVNLLFGEADPQRVVDIAGANADILMLQELTPHAVRELAAAGIDRSFPHQVIDARPQAAGAAIYSRYPITDSTSIAGYALALVSARIRVDGTARDTTVLSVHLPAPWPQEIGGWTSDLHALPGTLDDVAARAGGAPILVGGDFNATIDMAPFRRLLTNGYRTSSEQAGDGRMLTYPGNRRIPPFMGIDHVLTRNCTATAADTVAVTGTDHRALVATVMLPKG